MGTRVLIVEDEAGIAAPLARTSRARASTLRSPPRSRRRGRRSPADPTSSCSTSCCPTATAGTSPRDPGPLRRADHDAHRARRGDRPDRRPRARRRRLRRQAVLCEASSSRGSARSSAAGAGGVPEGPDHDRRHHARSRRSRKSRRPSRPIELAAKEFDLLHCLMSTPERSCGARRSWTRSGTRIGSVPPRRSMSTSRGCARRSRTIRRPRVHHNRAGVGFRFASLDAVDG